MNTDCVLLIEDQEAERVPSTRSLKSPVRKFSALFTRLAIRAIKIALSLILRLAYFLVDRLRHITLLVVGNIITYIIIFLVFSLIFEGFRSKYNEFKTAVYTFIPRFYGTLDP